MRQQIRRAMGDPDRLVVVFDYQDKNGNCTRRVVSPIRFTTPDRFLGLCLSREEPRLFQMGRVSNLKVAGAHLFLMPVPLGVLSGSDNEPFSFAQSAGSIPSQ